jgi:hypothetical protein
MQFDRVPATSRLPSLLLAKATERTLTLALQPDGTSRAVALQRAMRALCEEAHRQGMRAEELIVLFKRTWHARPELHHMSREENAQLFDAVVTMCIEEYYDGR